MKLKYILTQVLFVCLLLSPTHSFGAGGGTRYVGSFIDDGSGNTAIPLTNTTGTLTLNRGGTGLTSAPTNISQFGIKLSPGSVYVGDILSNSVSRTLSGALSIDSNGVVTLSNISGSLITGGTFGAVNGSALTNLNGTQITSGIVGTAEGGTGANTPSGGLANLNGLAIGATAGGALIGSYPNPTLSNSTLNTLAGGTVPSLLLGTSSTTAAAGNDSRITGALQSINNLSDVTTPNTALSHINGTQVFVPTAVKTGNYIAVPYDFIPVDTTSGTVVITLPTAPANLSRVSIKRIKGANTLTINTGGSDVFNIAGGSSSSTLTLTNQGTTLQYASSPAIWYAINDDNSLSQLDLRYEATNTTLSGLESAMTSGQVFVANGSGIPTPATLSGAISSVSGSGSVTLNNISGSLVTGGTFGTVNGSALTALNASQLTSGTVGTGVLGTGSASSTSVLIGNNTWGAVNLSSMTTGTLSGSAVSGVPLLSNANTFLSSNLFSKTIYADSGYLTNWATIATLSNTTAKIGTLTLTNALSGSSVSGGTFGAVNGSALTALNASQLTSGTVPTAQLGSGTANSGTVLLGNNTWGTYSLSALGGASLTANQTFTGSNVLSGGAAISAISGNAQGGLITNLDSAIFNVKDYGANINNAYAAMTNTSAAGVLYFPAISGNWTTSTKMIVGPNLQSGDGPAFTLRGTGTGDGGIGWTGANSVVYDSTGYQGLGLNFEHLRAVNNIGTSTGTNSFYIEGWGGTKAVRWDDLLLSQWLVGAEPSQSGADISALQLRNNAVGLWLPYQSDVDFINVTWSTGNTNAAIYADSQSHHIQLNSAGDNIGVIFDRGGESVLSGGAENITNAFATYGDPSNLPSWFTNNANNAGMEGLVIENGYMIGGGITNANSQGYPASLKIYNNSALGLISIRNFSVANADVVVFRTNTDSTQAISFDGIFLTGSNLVDFSDGTLLTSATASGLSTGHVGLNTTEQEFTKGTLEYGRDRTGDLYVAGTISNTTAKIGTLTLTNALSGSSVSGGTFGAVNGSALTALNGTQITSGTVPAAQLGSGTANSGTVLLGNNTWGTYSLSALGGIANNAGAGTNTSLVNPSLSGIESNTSSGTYIGTNLFTNGATFYAMTNYPKNLIGNGVSTLFTVNSSNHRHLWTITSGSLPAGALPGWDIMLTNLQFKIVMINSSTSFWTFDGGGSDFTGASVTAMYPNAVDWVDINHTPNGGIDNGASPFVQTIAGPTGNNGRIILGGGTNSFQLSIGSFNDGTDFTVEGMGGSNSAVGPTAVMTLNGQAPTSLQVLSNGIVNLSSRAYYGVSIGDYLNFNGVDASTLPPQLVWPTYSTTAARPYIVWDGNNNWMGIGPANTSDNTVRFGWTTGPFNGPSSEWPTFGTHPSPYEFDSSTFGIGINVPTHALDVSGTTAANFHQGIATMEDVSGSITATGWTNSLGTNAWVWPFGTAVTYIIFDAAGTPIVTNVTISTTDATGQPIQAGGKLTAASGLTGRYMAQ